MKTLTVILSISVAGLLVVVIYQQGSIQRLEQELWIQENNDRSNVLAAHAPYTIEQPTIEIPELEERFSKLDNTSTLMMCSQFWGSIGTSHFYMILCVKVRE